MKKWLKNRDVSLDTVAFFVFGIWMVMTLAALALTVRYLSPIPVEDAWLLARGSAGDLSWAWVWESQNEHRYPVVKLLAWLSHHGFGDLRPLSWLGVIACSATSLGMIIASARWRGKIVWADAFFPLALLHGLHMTNLIWTIQLFFILAGCLACWCLVYLMTPFEKRTVVCAVLGCLALLLLPLHGGMGLMFAPFFGLAYFLQGVAGLQKSSTKGVALLHVTTPVLAAGLCVLYLIGHPFFSEPSVQVVSAGGGEKCVAALECLATSFGHLGAKIPFFTGAALAGLTLFVLSAAAVLWRRRRLSGLAALSMACCAAAVWMVPVSVGVGRAGGETSLAMRYVILSVPVPCFVFLALSRLYPRFAGPAKHSVWRNVVRLSQMTLFALFCSFMSQHLMIGTGIAQQHDEEAKKIFAAVEKNASAEEIAAHLGNTWSWSQTGFLDHVQYMRQQGASPWDRIADAQISGTDILPLKEIIPLNMNRRDENVFTFDGKGRDSVLRFEFPEKRPVKWMILTFVLESDNMRPELTVRWWEEGLTARRTTPLSGEFSMKLRNFGRVPEKTIMVWVDAEIAGFEFSPGEEAFTVKLLKAEIFW